MNTAIEFALASDANYKMGLLVTACSLARFAAPESMLRFHILDGGLAEEDWDFFCRTVIDIHSATCFNRIRIDTRRFEAFPVWNGVGRLTYARLLLPTLLQDVEHVIYCDVDFLWLTDITDLWELRRENVICQAVHETTPSVLDREFKWFSERGLSFNASQYFCAGLCLLNLKLCRITGLEEKCLSFLAANVNVQFADQSSLNAVLGGPPLRASLLNYLPLPDRWQRLSRNVTDADVSQGCGIHYAGDTPWRRAGWYEALSDVVLLWYREYGRIYGIGLWRALRCFNGVWKTLYLRGVSLALTTPVIRSISYWIIEDVRKAVIGNELRMKNRRLKKGLR